MQVPYFHFRDFPAGTEAAVEQAVLAVLREKQFVLGPRVEAFEAAFSGYLGTGYTIGTGNGYDALLMALKALQIGAGDEVIVPANTFVATANAVMAAGATLVLAEPDQETYNLTATGIAPHLSPRTRAIIPVHLYGQACELDAILALAQAHGAEVIEDFAQSQGARYKGRRTGSFGKINATSFYPVKNLGALGDAGAVTTADADLAAFVRQYGNYGQSRKYHYAQIGINSRLDTLHAAVLHAKLPHLDQLNRERQRLAGIYLQQLAGAGDLVLPRTALHCEHIYHVFVIRTRHRDALQQYLKERGIGTLIHYPVAIHVQEAYQGLGLKAGDLPVTEELAATSLSLPLFPGMREEEQAYVCEMVRAFFERSA